MVWLEKVRIDMFKKIANKLLDVNQKELNKLEKIVEKVNSHEEMAKALKKSDFKKKTKEFKERIEKGESLDDILPEAFAVAREASDRELGMRPYDVQIMAAIALFQGRIVEQKTGEGKTLTAVPALYLRGLAGKGVHLVTVNDYLARRDAGWNAPVFELLGMQVGVIVQQNKSYVHDSKYFDNSHGDDRLAHLKPSERKDAYEADVTYGTNNEFGFDYLRDNMVQSLDRKAQRGHYFVIVDEVDSVLIDEARTPLIISSPDSEPTDKYYKFSKVVKKLKEDVDYSIDEKARSASLTEEGIAKLEEIMNVDNLYEQDYDSIHHIENALRASAIYKKDKDYVVNDGQIIIVDEFTGRLMHGRRWSDGMHQAVEAKEGVDIQQESKTMATISFQNYFRMYDHLSGMTGTAATEAQEFKEIYDLEVVVIPTNKPIARTDHADVVYKTLSAKYNALVKEVKERSEAGQPVLIGTTSIEKNEIVHNLLRRRGVKHNVLNAKNHEKEASIIADAGKPGAVTVATNMAGRGVDIVLGGGKPEVPYLESDEAEVKKKHKKDMEKYKKELEKWKEQHEIVLENGGLHVIGTERHESRRIDNQLRGRSGRQGDPGSTRFYLSLEDDLMRIFGGEQISNLMNRLRLPDDQPIENKLVSRAVEQAQVKVEGFHFDSRKNVVEYDDVANQQREVVYGLRNKLLEEDDVSDVVFEKIEGHVDRSLQAATDYDGKVDDEKLVISLMEMVPFDDNSYEKVKEEVSSKKSVEKKREFLNKVVDDVYNSREKQLSPKVMRQTEKFAYLSAIDHLWVDHIDYIDGLREGVRLRGYAQRDPKAEFKKEAFEAFEGLMARIDEELARRIFRVGVRVQRPEIPIDNLVTNADTSDGTGLVPETTVTSSGPTNSRSASSGKSVKKPASKKVGRNDPCPCGAVNPKSGKPYKYKKCGMINAPYHKV